MTITAVPVIESITDPLRLPPVRQDVTMLEFRLLGPIEARCGDGTVPLGGTKPRALLAALVLEHDHVVSASRLVDIVWPEDPPDSARALIQTYISSLRKSFAAQGMREVIDTRPPGYVVRLAPGTVDIDIFTGLVDRARAAVKLADDDKAATLLREALALWRGPALSGLEDTPLVAEARRLDELRLAALEESFDVELRLGRLDHVAELTGLVARHPANERLRGQLMTTLYRLGRQADALACYREGREALVDELGVEPGPELTALHGAILRGSLPPPHHPDRPDRPDRPEHAGHAGHTEHVGLAGHSGHAGQAGQAAQRENREDPDNALVAAAPPRASGGALSVVPAQIPPAPSDFTGRADELKHLVSGLTKPFPGVHIVAGQGGSGKSTLAALAAHRVAPSFPDGQLYAELHGMSDTPATAAEVLGGFLRALGFDPAHLPDTAQERTELFRSLVAGRRVLVLLDDAANEQQVRPLLPGGQGCGVLITARDRLPGLSGASLTELDVLGDEEALELLCRVAGPDRVTAEPEAAQSILRVCENLPLAIRVVGARLATRRHLPLQVLASRLTDERQRLDELSAGDLAVRTSIGLSYRALTDGAKVALRRMAFIGIPDFSAPIVARLLASSEAEAERRLELLVDAQLTTFTGPDRIGVLRYRLHDLVRLYARERAEQEEPAEALRASVARVVGGWLEALDRIALRTPPAEIVWRSAQPDQSAADAEFEGGHGAGYGDRHDAGYEDTHEGRRDAGFTDRLENGFENRFGNRAVDRAADGPANAFDTRILEDAALWMQGEEAAMAAGVERAAALGLHELACEFVIARVAVELEGANRFDFRARIIGAALEAARRGGDMQSEAGMLTQLAQLRYAQDVYDDSRRYFSEALSRFRLIHDVPGQAAALAGLGAACREPGRLAEAIHFLDQAAALVQALDDQRGIGYVHRMRGSVLLEQGAFDDARADLEMSLRAYQDVGSERGVAYTLRTIGLLHRAVGEYVEAMRVCGQSAAIFESLGDELMRSYAVRAEAKAQMRLGDAAAALPRLEWALWTARNAGDRWGQACTLRVLGQLHLSQGRLDPAESCLDAALSIWEVMDASLWRARTRVDLSMVYRARGQIEAADATLAEANQVFHDHGAREYREINTEKSEKY